MTRLRRPADSQDGPAVAAHNRPPADLIPAAFRERLAEYDHLVTEHEHAAADVRDMIDNWVTLRNEAIRADALAGATAVRDGAPIVVDTASTALDRRLEHTKAKRDALSLAARHVANELNDIRYAEQAKPGYANAVAKARAELHKATAVVSGKAEALAEAVALHEWLHEQLPWDAGTALEAREVAPAVAGHLTMERNPVYVGLNQILAAIDNL